MFIPSQGKGTWHLIKNLKELEKIWDQNDSHQYQGVHSYNIYWSDKQIKLNIWLDTTRKQSNWIPQNEKEIMKCSPKYRPITWLRVTHKSFRSILGNSTYDNNILPLEQGIHCENMQLLVKCLWSVEYKMRNSNFERSFDGRQWCVLPKHSTSIFIGFISPTQVICDTNKNRSLRKRKSQTFLSSHKVHLLVIIYPWKREYSNETHYIS